MITFRPHQLHCTRSFSISLPVLKRKTPPVQTITPEVQDVRLEEIPPYPFGESQWFKQSNRGLYGGGMKQFGNKISEGKNEGKTRRTWNPNVKIENLWSDALQKSLKLKVRRRVLRTIRKAGGLDNYLLGDTSARIKELGVFGWRLRWLILQSPSQRERLAQERKKLSLPHERTKFETFWRNSKARMDALRSQLLVDQEEHRRFVENVRESSGEDNLPEDGAELLADQTDDQNVSAEMLKPKRFMHEEMPSTSR